MWQLFMLVLIVVVFFCLLVCMIFGFMILLELVGDLGLKMVMIKQGVLLVFDLLDQMSFVVEESCNIGIQWIEFLQDVMMVGSDLQVMFL